MLHQEFECLSINPVNGLPDMGGAFESGADDQKKSTVITDICKCESTRAGFSICPFHSSSNNRQCPRGQTALTRLPAIETAGNKRDGTGNNATKSHGPWGDAKDGKDQIQDMLRFPRICKKWSPPPSGTHFFHLPETDISRLPTHLPSDAHINRQTTGPTTNPILLPIGLKESQTSIEKRMRQKSRKAKIDIQASKGVYVGQEPADKSTEM
ncbi:hypothetical protein CRM22_001553 [Opisthorchis felineus]|uniref:Uncharacterized protein n=1 Tax=Opisthorchis felineus TaxID=147828 RepID=A0A4S2MAB7_OPIFE|nr:hypothetical protein CRM22_001553 [Opisthorchis felineus]